LQLTQLVQALEAILAPALAGFLVRLVGLGAIFVVDFVIFGASIIALLVSAVPQPQISESRKSLWAEFAVGVNYIRERPALLYLMGFVTLTMFLLPGIGYALVTLLVLTFSSEQAAGLVVSGFGVGSFICGIALTVWGDKVSAGLGTMLVGLRESELLMAFGFVGVGTSFIFMVRLNRVIWQVKVAPMSWGAFSHCG